eukprot:CAMPEP_0177560780 /NCGR_PEP_ID=MMETSP0369-20130122/71569_1 /TAXON_ID=447022 ORGANISM="Scrippsiella hangoei-like, Strain SHHI-4" /NCGR_SAMPLE_ID=MMETSP0369 /ASSEMBLY_ACC=CAM_ASM_000364 /LENGTH=76 /DNA_ID=CAMNT_0019047633 /DNA_START=335 /DNA_END=565 /DNA_ORIENTATION=-
MKSLPRKLRFQPCNIAGHLMSNPVRWHRDLDFLVQQEASQTGKRSSVHVSFCDTKNITRRCSKRILAACALERALM